ncbi:MAG: thioredoxin domain-containing protein [Deltaproteobacteria bacterium]|nr:thioredoxin domain-containing protein [Deltaproteobacteria bacterium]
MPPNHLINEKSPYLIQHAHNPVDWHPWSDATFERAKLDNKPIFLSIGYATCHWCHVMEKESFEDEEAAGYLNDTFVCIKVDREERPDIDAVYMAACQMLTGSGGWPLSIFMTPQKKPFFAATYLPKNSRSGRAGLIDICRQVKDLWSNQNEKIETSAENISANLGRAFAFTAGDEPDLSLFEQTFKKIRATFDLQYGGFEPAPKFPTPHRLLFLLRYYHRNEDSNALDMVLKTLTAMRLGGIWDHVGHGFHRYSTDERWLLPHFEKMLYDQALIATAYLEAYQITKDPLLAETAEEIFTYVLRDMTSTEGGFYSAEDADSEGEEGKFYVWSTEELRPLLGHEDARRWETIFRISPEGNFTDEATRQKTGANILHLTAPLGKWSEKLNVAEDQLRDEWRKIRDLLFHTRQKRIHPLKDDKILTDWNGLMIAALALGARILEKPQYESAARKAAEFIQSKMLDKGGRLYHRYRDGELAVDANAADYAFLIQGLLSLYQTTFDLAYAEQAKILQEKMIEDFWDDQNGGFFSTPKASTDLPVRPKELYDGAIPSANSMALFNLVTLFRLTGDPKWDNRAQALVQAFAGTVKTQPQAFTYFLCALDFALRPGQEIIIAGEPQSTDTRQLLAALNLNFTPNKVAIVKSDQNAERLAKFAGYTDGLQVIEGQATAHVCRNGSCTDSTTESQTMVDRILGRK